MKERGAMRPPPPALARLPARPPPPPRPPPLVSPLSPFLCQAPGDDSEVYLVPQAIYRDPFRGGDNILVMCDAYNPPAADGSTKELTPIPTNTRFACAKACAAAAAEEPWFGIEQEYSLLNTQTKWPLGWPSSGYPGPQGPYYCSAGAGAAIGRDIIEAHYKACLYAGIAISGVNAEVMPAQWEYQVGPCTGIAMGDQLWMSRYILLRVCEVRSRRKRRERRERREKRERGETFSRLGARARAPFCSLTLPPSLPLFQKRFTTWT